MNKQLLALYLERGRLQERITQQRLSLVTQWMPLQKASATANSVMTVGQGGFGFLRKHSWLVVMAVAAFVVLRPKGSWWLVQRGWMLWRGWRMVRGFAESSSLSPLYQLIWQRYVKAMPTDDGGV